MAELRRAAEAKARRDADALVKSRAVARRSEAFVPLTLSAQADWAAPTPSEEEEEREESSTDEEAEEKTGGKREGGKRVERTAAPDGTAEPFNYHEWPLRDTAADPRRGRSGVMAAAGVVASLRGRARAKTDAKLAQEARLSAPLSAPPSEAEAAMARRLRLVESFALRRQISHGGFEHLVETHSTKAIASTGREHPPPPPHATLSPSVLSPLSPPSHRLLSSSAAAASAGAHLGAGVGGGGLRCAAVRSTMPRSIMNRMADRAAVVAASSAATAGASPSCSQPSYNQYGQALEDPYDQPREALVYIDDGVWQGVPLGADSGAGVGASSPHVDAMGAEAGAEAEDRGMEAAEAKERRPEFAEERDGGHIDQGQMTAEELERIKRSEIREAQEASPFVTAHDWRRQAAQAAIARAATMRPAVEAKARAIAPKAKAAAPKAISGALAVGGGLAILL